MNVEERLAPKIEPLTDSTDFIKPELDLKDNCIVCSGCGYRIHEEYILKVSCLLLMTDGRTDGQNFITKNQTEKFL